MCKNTYWRYMSVLYYKKKIFLEVHYRIGKFTIAHSNTNTAPLKFRGLSTINARDDNPSPIEIMVSGWVMVYITTTQYVRYSAKKMNGRYLCHSPRSRCASWAMALTMHRNPAQFVKSFTRNSAPPSELLEFSAM